jgi:hypothetical protein
MTVRGTAEEIKETVKGLVPAWPYHLIDSLDPGEWHFILNGIDTLVIIEEERNDNLQM